MSTEPTNVNATTSAATSADPAARIAQLERQLIEANQRAASIEWTHRINNLQREARAIDLDTAHLLVERAMTSDATRDPEAIIADLVATKPFLFAAEAPGASGTGSAATRTGVLAPRATDRLPSPLVEAADEARITGKRGDVLRYLRLRRSR